MRKKKSIDKKISNQYKESFEFIKETKNFIFATIIIFFLFSLIGFFTPTPPQIQEAIIKFIQELIEKTKDMSQSQLTSFIFTNNLQSAFLGMILGVFLGVFPIITAIANGYLLGYVAKIATQSESILILWKIFPHGIFELPAVFISLGLGLRLSAFIFQKEKIKTLKILTKKSIKTFILVVIPLLIIGALIEGALIFIQR